jgi:hypothetical protein
VWVANYWNHDLARMTPNGAVTIVSDPAIRYPSTVVGTPDGGAWFSNIDPNRGLGRVAPNGAVSINTDPGIGLVTDLVALPDGGAWFSTWYPHTIGHVEPDGTVTSFADPGIVAPLALTLGPDGNIWFVNFFNETHQEIGKLTPAGAVTTFADPAIAFGQNFPELIAGPDGNLWFSLYASGRIGRMTTAGAITTFDGPEIGAPYSVAAGPDGNIWFTDLERQAIGRITPAGVVTSFSDPTVQKAGRIVAGSDGALWFSQGNHSISRIIAVEGSSLTFTARYSASKCAAYQAIAAQRGFASPAPILQFGIAVFGALEANGRAAPIADPVPNEGPCEITVFWPATAAARLAEIAQAWGLTLDELHHYGGELVLAILYILSLSP